MWWTSESSQITVIATILWFLITVFRHYDHVHYCCSSLCRYSKHMLFHINLLHSIFLLNRELLSHITASFNSFFVSRKFLVPKEIASTKLGTAMQVRRRTNIAGLIRILAIKRPKKTLMWAKMWLDAALFSVQFALLMMSSLAN